MAKSTTATRHFLGWSAPILPAAAAHLAGLSDLSRAIVITPGARAGRTLSDLLADQRSDTARGPHFLTPGQAIDTLIRMPAAAAGSLARRLAWIDALRSTPPDELSPLVPRPPRDFAAWSALAATLQQTHAELAAELLLFADVPDRAAHLPDFADAERWGAAANLQRRYAEVLAAQGLVDPDLWRLDAINDPDSGPPPIPVVLVGVSDLGAAARAVLHRAGGRVTALIAAPADLADCFDGLGCITPERWSSRTVPIPDNSIIFADHPADQADHAFATLASLDARYAARQIVIAIPDPEVVPYLDRCAAAASITVRNAAGIPLSRTAPFRLLAAIADHLELRCFRTLAALVRHPDVEQHLLATLTPPHGEGACEWWLAEMDQYAADSLHDSIDDAWHTTTPALLETLRHVNSAIQAALGTLWSARAPAPLRDWAAPIAAALARIYASAATPDPAQAAPHTALAELIASIAALPESADAIPISVAEALRLVLSEASNLAVPPSPDPNAIELLGWLELPFDPAPVAIITGMNEGRVPTRPASSPLLPDRLRQALNLPCDSTLHARDAYLLSAITASRPTTTLIGARRGKDGDPLTPSRLLFACEGPALVRRILRFTDTTPAPPIRLHDPVQPGPSSRFIPRPVRDSAPVKSLAVTAFRTYIASPYLFYLRHIARLHSVEPDAAEIDASAYGRLIHDALDAFGKGPERHSADPDRIEQFLSDSLSSLALRRFGAHPCAAVQIQLALLRRRLRDFARAQADHRRQGWLIERVEWTPRPAPLDVDGDPFGLTGRIDRIDRHESDGRLILIDYKSGSNPTDPDRSHRTPDGWKDLQLPLYRHLALAARISLDPERLAFAYFVLPSDAGSARILQSAWSPADLDSADDAARDIIRKIRRREFSDLGDRPRIHGAVAALCGLGFIGELPADDEGGDE